MAITDDVTALITVWGQTLTTVRRTVAYGDTAKPTPTWAAVESRTGYLYPAGDSSVREAIGVKTKGTHSIIYESAANIREQDRVRKASWVAGDDEYEVVSVETIPYGATLVGVNITSGHGG